MAREHPALRDNMEDILEFFQGKRVLTQADLCRYSGRTPRWVKDHYKVGNHETIGYRTFARILCEPT